jgi:CBS domain-containing protein
MNTTKRRSQGCRLILDALTAGDLMTANPISVQANLGVRQAMTFLIAKAFSAAPVIDEAGRPVGVLSQTDLLIHNKAILARSPASANFYGKDGLTDEAVGMIENAMEAFDQEEATVRDVMTPVVLSVTLQTSADKVIKQLLEQGVHRLFVVDDAGVLVGVISTMDILEKLVPQDEIEKV